MKPDTQARFMALAEVAEAQRKSIARLADTVDKQAEMIAALTVALGAVIDIVVTDDMRGPLEAHFQIAIAQQAPEVARWVSTTLFK
jgi:hypothetical protein